MPRKKTLVLGSSTNPHRYSYRAIHKLNGAGHPILAVGRSQGIVDGIDIMDQFPRDIDDIHTITLYLRSELQAMYYDDILKSEPKRIIFNPGTENLELVRLAKANGIETRNACTLVMLSIDDF